MAETRETVFTMDGNDHTTWHVHTEHPMWLARLSKLCTVGVPDLYGVGYVLSAKEFALGIRFRKSASRDVDDFCESDDENMALKGDERATTFIAPNEQEPDWVVFTNDPYWSRRLDRFTVPYATSGESRWYRLTPAEHSVKFSKRRKGGPIRGFLKSGVSVAH